MLSLYQCIWISTWIKVSLFWICMHLCDELIMNNSYEFMLFNMKLYEVIWIYMSLFYEFMWFLHAFMWILHEFMWIYMDLCELIWICMIYDLTCIIIRILLCSCCLFHNHIIEWHIHMFIICACCIFNINFDAYIIVYIICIIIYI